MFEHGCDSLGLRVPCTVDHAHLHLVPTAADIVVDLPADRHWICAEGGIGAIAPIAGDGEYLYYEAPDVPRQWRVQGGHPSSPNC